MLLSESKILALQEVEIGSGEERYGFLIAENEHVEMEFKTVRDRLVFTNKRLIAIDVQGILGNKMDISVIPYNKINGFSVETAGTFDMDSELTLFTAALGSVQFEFLKGTDIKALAQVLSRYL